MWCTSNSKQEAGSRKQEAGSRKQEVGSRKQETGSKKREKNSLREPPRIARSSNPMVVMEVVRCFFTKYTRA